MAYTVFIACFVFPQTMVASYFKPLLIVKLSFTVAFLYYSGRTAWYLLVGLSPGKTHFITGQFIRSYIVQQPFLNHPLFKLSSPYLPSLSLLFYPHRAPSHINLLSSRHMLIPSQTPFQEFILDFPIPISI